MAEPLQLAVRFLHILFGVAWVGGAILMGHSVAGGLKTAPPNVRGPAMNAVATKAATLFAVAAPLTLIFGLWNQYLIAGELRFEGSPWNLYMGTSLILTLIMLVIAYAVQMPTIKKLKAIAAGDGDKRELPALQKKMVIGGVSITVLGIIVVGLMVAATGVRLGIA